MQTYIITMIFLIGCIRSIFDHHYHSEAYFICTYKKYFWFSYNICGCIQAFSPLSHRVESPLFLAKTMLMHRKSLSSMSKMERDIYIYKERERERERERVCVCERKREREREREREKPNVIFLFFRPVSILCQYEYILVCLSRLMSIEKACRCNVYGLRKSLRHFYQCPKKQMVIYFSNL